RTISPLSIRAAATSPQSWPRPITGSGAAVKPGPALDRERLLVQERRRHVAHLEDVGRLARRHAADNGPVKGTVAALEGALLPDLLHVGGEDRKSVVEGKSVD